MLSKFPGQVKVPSSPAGALNTCPGILQTRTNEPIKIKICLPVNEHTET
jgi:hypothetical protein